jgi:type I restriction enzyme R subunit
VAVTVDMIATGTDVKPIECLFFLRDVRSKNYFEQMTGRGTRVLSLEELQKVSPTAKTNKDRFVLFDAVGVLKSLKTENRTFERNPGISFQNLLMKIATGNRSEDVLTTVAGRVTRLIQSCTIEQIEEFKNLSPNKTMNRIAADLLNCFDEDIVYARAKSLTLEPTEADMTIAKAELLDEAISPFNKPEIRDFLVAAKKITEQFISAEIDQVSFSDISQAQEEKAKEIRDYFKKFIEDNKDTIDALSIIYYQDYKRRPLTFDAIKRLYSIISQPPHNISVRKLSDVYYILDSSKCPNLLSMTVDIVSFVRFEYGQSNEIVSFRNEVNRKYKHWIFEKNAGGLGLNQEQNDWLKSIRNHITESGGIEIDDFEYTPFIEKGGLGKFAEVFGTQYASILNEVNYILQS